MGESDRDGVELQAGFIPAVPRRESSKRHPNVAWRGGFRGGILIPPRYLTADHIVMTAAAIFRVEY